MRSKLLALSSAVACCTLLVASCSDDESPSTPGPDGGTDVAPDRGSTVDSGRDSGAPDVNDSGANEDADAGADSGDDAGEDAEAGGPACSPNGTLFTVTNSGAASYIINGVMDPVLTLCRGYTYMFAVTAPGHPFWIKTAQTIGTGDGAPNVTNNGAVAGTVTFAPAAAQASPFYICQYHPQMTNRIVLVDP